MLKPIQLIRQILIEELTIPDDRVIVYNQKWTIPPTDDLFVVVEFKHAKPFSSRNFMDASNREIQELNMQEFYTIGIFSRSTEALFRKHEVLMALGSIFSQQLQETNSFKISKINPIVDLSPLESTALIYRFDIDIVLFSWYEKTKVADYYNEFFGKVYTETLSVPFTQVVPTP